MSLRVEVARLVAWMVVVLARNFLHARVPVTVRIEVARSVTGVIMMFTRDFLGGLVAMPVLVEVARDVPGVVVVLAWLLFWHDGPPGEFLIGRLGTRIASRPVRLHACSSR